MKTEQIEVSIEVRRHLGPRFIHGALLFYLTLAIHIHLFQPRSGQIQIITTL